MRLPIFALALTTCFVAQLSSVGTADQRLHAQENSAAQLDVAESAAVGEEASVGSDVAATEASLPPSAGSSKLVPIILLVIGIVSVLGMIIGLKLNAFIALIISALIVSLGVGLVKGEDAGSRMNAVVNGFGSAAGSIGIVIAMAAIIGKCMLDSGAADRIVRGAVNVTGEKKASLGLMASGFVLAIPVFFDTVFYLLGPPCPQSVSSYQAKLSSLFDGDCHRRCDHTHLGSADAGSSIGRSDPGC